MISLNIFDDCRYQRDNIEKEGLCLHIINLSSIPSTTWFPQHH